MVSGAAVNTNGNDNVDEFQFYPQRTLNLTPGSVTRTGNTDATVKFISGDAGAYNYQIGGTVPFIHELIWSCPKNTMIAGENTINLTTLAAGRNTIYIAAIDESEKKANMLTITIPAYSTGGGVGGGGGVPGASLSPNKADFDLQIGGDVSSTLNDRGFTLNAVKLGSYTLQLGTDYTVNGNTVTFNSGYLAGLSVGTFTFVFEMSGGSSPKFTLTVKDGGSTLSGPEPMKPTRPAGTFVEATKATNPLFLNGEEVDFPAVKIDGWNWLKLRDVAMLLNGTSKQISVGYDPATNTVTITTGAAYSPLGDELTDTLEGDPTAIASPQKIVFNGQLIDVAAYNIKGCNYFRLRGLMILLDIAVVYDEANGVITLDLDKPYTVWAK